MISTRVYCNDLNKTSIDMKESSYWGSDFNSKRLTCYSLDLIGKVESHSNLSNE